MVIAAMKLNDAYSLDRTEVLWLRWTAQGIGEVLPLAQGRGGVQEELPHIQGVAAARAQEGREELAIPHSRSGGLAVRRYPLFKVRSSGCALLEQP